MSGGVWIRVVSRDSGLNARGAFEKVGLMFMIGLMDRVFGFVFVFVVESEVVISDLLGVPRAYVLIGSHSFGQVGVMPAFAVPGRLGEAVPVLGVYSPSAAFHEDTFGVPAALTALLGGFGFEKLYE